MCFGFFLRFCLIDSDLSAAGRCAMSTPSWKVFFFCELCAAKLLTLSRAPGCRRRGGRLRRRRCRRSMWSKFEWVFPRLIDFEVQGPQLAPAFAEPPGSLQRGAGELGRPGTQAAVLWRSSLPPEMWHCNEVDDGGCQWRVIQTWCWHHDQRYQIPECLLGRLPWTFEQSRHRPRADRFPREFCCVEAGASKTRLETIAWDGEIDVQCLCVDIAAELQTSSWENVWDSPTDTGNWDVASLVPFWWSKVHLAPHGCRCHELSACQGFIVCATKTEHVFARVTHAKFCSYWFRPSNFIRLVRAVSQVIDPKEKDEFINAGGLKALTTLADRFLESAPAANSLKDW